MEAEIFGENEVLEEFRGMSAEDVQRRSAAQGAAAAAAAAVPTCGLLCKLRECTTGSMS